MVLIAQTGAISDAQYTELKVTILGDINKL